MAKRGRGRRRAPQPRNTRSTAHAAGRQTAEDVASVEVTGNSEDPTYEQEIEQESEEIEEGSEEAEEADENEEENEQEQQDSSEEERDELEA